jgi:hypothetical protein
LFNYFSVYDIFTFSTNLLIFLRKISIQKNINVNNKIIDLLNNISKKSYHYLEQIIIEENYDNSRTHKFPNYLLLEEFFKEHLVNTNEIDNINITDIFSIYDIDKYHNYKQIKLYLSKIINNIDNSNITENIKNKIIQFTKQLEKNTESEKLDIEKIINNEYYKIKSNLLLTIDTISNSLNESTESFSIDNI